MSIERVKNISIDPFDYSLPDERIAKFPASPRDNSKLLVYENGTIRQDNYYNLDQFLPEDAVLVLNDTKVVEARLLFQKNTGGTIELFCLEPAAIYSDIVTAMTETGSVDWICLVGGLKKWKEDQLISSRVENGKTIELSAQRIEKEGDAFLIRLRWNAPEMSFAEILHLFGNVPLPPYIKREVNEKDASDYQTVYAHHDGSVAAPTAGLHFTESLFEKLKTKGIQQQFVTLHVGAGTFKPVKADNLGDHEMHAEYIDVSLEFLKHYLAKINQSKIAVGTTSIRTLETLYWLGVKCKANLIHSLDDLTLSQWDAYELPQDFSVEESLSALIQKMTALKAERILQKTQLLIAPGYQVRMVDAILTNFHQPKSTLLLLIHAFVGENWRTIYDYALEHDFRFLSFGDGSLLWLEK